MVQEYSLCVSLIRIYKQSRTKVHKEAESLDKKNRRVIKNRKGKQKHVGEHPKEEAHADLHAKLKAPILPCGPFLPLSPSSFSFYSFFTIIQRIFFYHIVLVLFINQ